MPNIRRNLTIRRSNGVIRAKETYNHLYMPVYYIKFYVAEDHETPFLNKIRLLLGLDSAESHTTIVHDETFVGSYLDTETRKDDNAGISSEGLEELRCKGYEVITLEDAVDRYDKDDVPSKLRRRMEKYETEQERKKEKLERIKKDREFLEENLGEAKHVMDCDYCAGYVVMRDRRELYDCIGNNIDPRDDVMYTYMGKNIVQCQHEDGCRHNEMINKTIGNNNE